MQWPLAAARNNLVTVEQQSHYSECSQYQKFAKPNLLVVASSNLAAMSSNDLREILSSPNTNNTLQISFCCRRKTTLTSILEVSYLCPWNGLSLWYNRRVFNGFLHQNLIINIHVTLWLTLNFPLTFLKHVFINTTLPCSF